MPEHWNTVLELARRLPEVEEGTSYGTPALRVRGKFFARLREDGETLVVKMNIFGKSKKRLMLNSLHATRG